MKMKILFFIGLLTICFACNKQNRTSLYLENCPNLAMLKILTETEKQNACHYLDVYLYQSAIYSICECCVCDKAAAIIACDGQSLCEPTQMCLVDFYEDAAYLFAVAEQ